MFIVVTCLLLLHVYCCYMFIVVTCLLLLHVYCCYMFIVVTCLLLFPGAVHVVYVVQPSQFMKKKSVSLSLSKERDKLEFTVSS